MKVRYIASACVVIEHAGKRVLCDPWLTDGIYYGSWYHYPPLCFVPEDFVEVDYIYISHIHPDHLDVETLKRMPRSVPVIILDYTDKFIRRILVGLGFQQVIEVPHQGEVSLAQDFRVQIFAADNCDSKCLSRFFGCAIPGPYERTMQIDSLAVFHGAGKTVVNLNDCPYDLAHTVCDSILGTYNTVDFAMVGYSGAGEYPQCFENLDETLWLEKAEAKRQQYLNQAVDYLNLLQPLAFMPFAGKYTLGGRLSKLNRLRGVSELEKAASELQHMVEQRRQSAKLVLLNSGEWFDVETGNASAPFIPLDPIEEQRYIDDVLSKKKFVYEEECRVEEWDWIDLTLKLREAQKRLLRYQAKWGYSSEWRVYLDTGQGHLYCIPFNGHPVERAALGTEREPFVRISLDYSLLNMILDRRAHWNNAAIGSHLRFFRCPETYERAVYELLSYLHC